MSKEKEEIEEMGMEALQEGDSDFLMSMMDETKPDIIDEDEEEEEEEIIEPGDSNDPPNPPNPDEEEEQEEEEEEEEEEERESSQSKSGKESTSPNDLKDTLFSFASVLRDGGVLTSSVFNDETKIESLDDLVDLMRKQNSENEFAGLNDRQKKYLTALNVGLSEDEFIQNELAYERIASLKADDLDGDDKLEFRKQLIYEDFIQRGFNEARAKTLTERSVDSGADLEDAQLALTSKQERLKSVNDANIAARQKQIDNAAKSQAEYRDKIKEKVFDEKAEIIPGIKNNKAIAARVFDAMTKPVDFTEDSRPLNKLMKARMDDPIGFEHKLYYLFEYTNGFTDFSNFEKRSKTKAAQEFERKLGLNTLSPGGNTPDGGGGSDDFMSKLDALEKSLK